MRRVHLRAAIACALLFGIATTSATAQTATNSDTTNGLTLRERLDYQRSDARRTTGERSLTRTSTQQEARRQLLLRQRNSGVGSTRSVPILPKTNSSSVVVTQ